jgi:hypothetical protein
MIVIRVNYHSANECKAKFSDIYKFCKFSVDVVPRLDNMFEEMALFTVQKTASQLQAIQL